MATILVVDDDANNRSLVRTIAEHVGHDILEAVDAATAAALCENRGIDLVVLDLHLPDIDGAELLRRLRRDPKTATLRIALYTATPVHSALRDLMELYSVGDYIAKPAEPRLLMNLFSSLP